MSDANSVCGFCILLPRASAVVVLACIACLGSNHFADRLRQLERGLCQFLKRPRSVFRCKKLCAKGNSKHCKHFQLHIHLTYHTPHEHTKPCAKKTVVEPVFYSFLCSLDSVWVLQSLCLPRLQKAPHCC